MLLMFGKVRFTDTCNGNVLIHLLQRSQRQGSADCLSPRAELNMNQLHLHLLVYLV